MCIQVYCTVYLPTLSTCSSSLFLLWRRPGSSTNLRLPIRNAGRQLCSCTRCWLLCSRSRRHIWFPCGSGRRIWFVRRCCSDTPTSTRAGCRFLCPHNRSLASRPLTGTRQRLRTARTGWSLHPLTRRVGPWCIHAVGQRSFWSLSSPKGFDLVPWREPVPFVASMI